ncbi:MAG: hypothetical protein IJT34_03885 [Butyrivibrio sp.]|nr:hypothetical protein [Butyrivibrio sp.]
MNHCRQCLLRDLADQADVLAQVARTRKMMSETERASDAVYEKRLEVCRACDRLLDATCQKCGCYVEIRALARTAHCPGKKW